MPNTLHTEVARREVDRMFAACASGDMSPVRARPCARLYFGDSCSLRAGVMPPIWLRWTG